MAGRPILNSIIICDQAIKEEGSNKWSLIGVFSSIIANVIPSIHGGFSLYLAITEIHNSATIKVEALAGEGTDEKKLIELGGEIRSEDPRAVGEFVVRFPGFPIVQEGVHTIRVVWEGERLGGTRFEVRRLQA